MENSLELYRSAITGQPACTELEFPDLLRRFRAGDEESGHLICGCYLGEALDLVESLPSLPEGLTPLDVVQEANAGLVEALHTFTGSTASEFAEHARQTILTWLIALDDPRN